MTDPIIGQCWFAHFMGLVFVSWWWWDWTGNWIGLWNPVPWCLRWTGFIHIHAADRKHSDNMITLFQTSEYYPKMINLDEDFLYFINLFLPTESTNELPAAFRWVRHKSEQHQSAGTVSLSGFSFAHCASYHHTSVSQNDYFDSPVILCAMNLMWTLVETF